MTLAQRLQKIDKKIATGNWFQYVNPAMDIVINIDRKIIERVMEDIPEVDGNWLNACQAIAGAAERHLPGLTAELATSPYAQSEYLLLQPFQATWHFFSYQGNLYVSTTQFAPYV